MSWLGNIVAGILFKFVITPKNVKTVLSKLADKLEELAASTETDFDDKAVDVFKEAFEL